MDDEPAPVRAAPDAELAACWPLLAVEVAERADRLALATVVATVDPAEGLAAAWAGVTVITRAARALSTLGPVDAIAWEHARPCASAVVRALLDAPSLPDAGRLSPGRTRWTTPHPGDARRSPVGQGRPAAVDNTRTGLMMLCRHLTRMLSVLSLRAARSADQAAAADAAGHAERLAAALCTVPASPTPAPSARVPGLRPASLPPAA